MAVDFVVVSDVHFDGLRTLLPNDHFNASQREVFYQVGEYAKQNNIHFGILPGDLFDNPNPSQDTLNEALAVMLDSPIEWHIIPGNHDAPVNSSPDEFVASSQKTLSFLARHTRDFSRVVVYDEPTLTTIADIPFYFLPHPYHKNRDYLLPSGCAHPFVGIGHFALDGSKCDNGFAMSLSLKRENLGALNFWILGHQHLPQVFDNGFHPGAPIQTDFGSAAKVGFWHCRASFDGAVLKVQRKFISTYEESYQRRLYNVTITTDDDIEALDARAVEDPNALFKAHILADLRFSEKWTATPRPAVVRYKTIGNRSKKNRGSGSSRFQEAGETEETETPGAFRGVLRYLLEDGLSPEQQMRAREIIETIVGQIKEAD